MWPDRSSAGVDVGDLVGRAEECAAAHTLLDRSRLIMVHGPAGIGKSRVARAVALAAASAHRDGVALARWWRSGEALEAATGREPVREVARALGLPGEPGLDAL